MLDLYDVIGVVGGALGIITTIANLVTAWRGRSRLGFRVLRASCFVVPYTQNEINSVGRGPTPDWKPSVRPGDIRRAFSIIEFSVQNNYPTAVTIGRIDIDGWMYSDHWHPPMYSYLQDYRVFDIYDKKRVDLSHYYRIPTGDTLARRVEAFEDTHGLGYFSHGSRYRLEKRDQFVITIHSDVGTITKTVAVKTETVRAWDLERGRVAHWSDLLPEWQPDSGPAPEP
jgi:hypothetical protein